MKKSSLSVLGCLLVSCACIFAPCVSAQAALLAYDGLSSGNYAAGQLLGQNPAITGFTGAWAGGSNIFWGNSTRALTYYGIASNDTGGAFSNTPGNRTGRDFSVFYSGNRLLYMSLMMKNTAVGGADYRAFELYSYGHRLIQVGANGDNGDSGANWGMRVMNSNALRVTTNVAATANQTVFAVLRITLSTIAGADAVRLWINPTNPQSETASTNFVTLGGFDYTNNHCCPK